MQIGSGFDIAVSGIRKGVEGLERNANRIAQTGTTDQGTNADLTQPLVEQQANQHQVEASTKTAETANRTLGSLLDVTV